MKKDSSFRKKIFLYSGIALIFVLSQILAYLLGVRFAGSKKIIIEPFWQYLDSKLLETDLIESLFYLHSQPPLFNAFIGLILKLFPNHYELAFALILRATGLGVLFLMASVMRSLGVHSVITVLLCSLFAIFPNFLVYSNLLFYTLPVCFLLLLSCFFLQRFAEGRDSRSALWFALTCAVIMMTRSIYHLAWFFICTAFIFWILAANSRKAFLRAATIPVLILAALYAKNAVIAGSPGPSSWLGMNLARGWLPPSASAAKHKAFLQREDFEQLHRANQLNREWAAGPFSNPDGYKQLGYFKVKSQILHPSIGAPEKSGGFPNFNHLDYAKLSNKMLETDLSIIRNFPERYFARVVLCFEMYLQPATGPSWFLVQSYDYSGLERYRHLIGRLLFFARPIELRKGFVPWNALYLLFPLTIVFGLVQSVKSQTNAAAGHRLIYLFITITVIWVALISNMIEFGENNRIRYETDPFLTILFGGMLQKIWNRIRPSVQ